MLGTTSRQSPEDGSSKGGSTLAGPGDALGKQRRGENGGATPNRTESGKAAASSMQEQAKPIDTDSSLLVDAGEGGEAMLEDTRGDAESEEKDTGSGEAPAPSGLGLARSLGLHRSTLQQIRRRLHGQGNTQAQAQRPQGITSRLTALLMWIALQA